MKYIKESYMIIYMIPKYFYNLSENGNNILLNVYVLSVRSILLYYLLQKKKKKYIMSKY